MKKKNNDKKTTINIKYVIIIGVILFLVLVGLIVIFNKDNLFLPNDSITINLEDDEGSAIEGLIIEVVSEETDTYHNYEFIDGKKSITVDGLDSGSYRVYLRHIPVGYKCKTRMEVVILENDDKLNLNYTCDKVK